MVLPEPWVQPGPANDEILYTSSDGNIVSPYQASSLPTIISNTYVGGKGIIKFATELKTIGRNAFHNCDSLTSVTIPDGVTTIWDWAFYQCSGLTSISYTGTIAQYNSISKGLAWNGGVPAKVVHCSDGDTSI